MPMVARDAWMQRLAEAIRPRSPRPTALALGRMLQFLVDVSDDAFTDESLQFVAARLRNTPNLAIMREQLDAYLQTQRAPSPKPETATDKLRREQAERDAFLRRDWDDPGGILARVRTCEGDLRFLRVLGLAVGKYAPQHIGLIPPHVLESLARDPDVRLPVFEEIRARGLSQRSHASDDSEPQRAPIRTAHLTPEQIELAGGRKRTDAKLAPATDTPSAVALDPDAAARMEGAYPARDDREA